MIDNDDKLALKDAIPHLRRVLTGLSEEQIEHLQARISGHLKRRVAKRMAEGGSAEVKAMAQEKAKAAEAAKISREASEKERMAQVEAWSRQYLKPGMLVKVRTSNPNKVRLVTKIEPAANDARMVFYGEHLVQNTVNGAEVLGVGTKLSPHFGDIILNVVCHGKDPSKPVIIEPGYEKPSIAIAGDQSDWTLVPISKFLENAKVSEAA